MFLTPWFLSLLWSEREKPVLAIQPPTLTLASQELWSMVVSKSCIASDNWCPWGSQTGGMVAGGSSRQSTDEVCDAGELFHSSLCLVNIGFMQVGAIFCPSSLSWLWPSLLPLRTSVQCLCASLPPTNIVFVCQWQGGNIEQTPTSQTFNSICFKMLFTQSFQFCAFYLLFHPHGSLHKSFPKIKSS